jgi:hypothetical protein
MCDRCKSAASELAAFVDELLQKYPATEVEGQPTPTNHHVLVALLTEMTAQKALYAFEAQQLGLGPSTGMVN